MKAPLSMHRALLSGTTLGLLLVLASAGFVLERSARRALYGQLDRELASKARLLASTVEQDAEGIDLGYDDLDLSEFEAEIDPALLQVSLASGKLLYASPSCEGLVIAPPAQLRAGEPRFSSLRGPRSRRLRAAVLSFRPRVDIDEPGAPDPASVATLVIFLARGTQPIAALLAELRLALLLVGIGAVALGVLIQAAVIRRALSPLDRLAGEIAGLGERRLAARVKTAGAPGELAPVIARLNALLADLETAFTREKTFSADIAHELRTPLAGLRTTIEVELSQARPAEDYRRALEESLAMSLRLQQLVESLMQLAQLEAGRVRVEARPVDLAELLDELWAPLAAQAVERGLGRDWQLPERAPAATDPELAATLLRNLLENAVVHADAGGRVAVALGAAPGGGWRCTIANSGSAVSELQLPGLMERFARGDAAREAEGGHFGLGLALVKRIAGLLGVDFGLASSPGGEFRATLEFPARLSDVQPT